MFLKTLKKKKSSVNMRRVNTFTHLELLAWVNPKKCELMMIGGTPAGVTVSVFQESDLKEKKKRKQIEPVLAFR